MLATDANHEEGAEGVAREQIQAINTQQMLLDALAFVAVAAIDVACLDIPVLTEGLAQLQATAVAQRLVASG